MTKRVKTSTVLEYARKRIHARSDEYICHAVEGYDFDFMPEVKRTLRLIHSRMQMGRFEKWVDKNRYLALHGEDPYYQCETSLEWWLVWKGHVKLGNWPTKWQMREYRLAWLDELIKECKAKGD